MAKIKTIPVNLSQQYVGRHQSSDDQAIKDHVPTKRTPARHTHPWVDTRLRRASRRKNRAFHKVKQTKSPVDWNRYKRLKMLAQKDMRSAHMGESFQD